MFSTCMRYESGAQALVAAKINEMLGPETLIRHFLQTYKFGQLRRIDVSSGGARGASGRLSCIGLQDYVTTEFARSSSRRAARSSG
jgi:hypothetical protein